MVLDPITLGSLIRKRRKDMGLTLNDLANDSVSVPTISNIERGITGNLASEKVTYIREQLGLTDELVEQMLKKTGEDEERLKQMVATVRHLAEHDLLTEARHEVSALEKDGKLADYPLYATTTQLLKGVVLRKQGQWERATNAFHEVLRHLREHSLTELNNLAAEAYYNLSVTAALADQDYEKAIEYADMALDAIQKEGDEKHIEGRVLYNKASYSLHLEQYGQAFKYVMEARPKCELAHDMKCYLLTYNAEGLILSGQHLYVQAAEVFQHAIHLQRIHYADPWLGSVLYLNLGDALYRNKAYAQALHYYDLSYRLCKERKDEQQRALLYCSYGEVYLAMGEYEKATEYANRAAELAQKFDYTSEYLPILLLKANIALEQSSSEITSICAEGIRLAERSKLFNKKKDFHFVLANYYERTGNRESFLQEAEHMYQVESLIRKEETL